MSGWLGPGELPPPAAVKRVALRPGDVLFLPARVCHRVTTAGPSLTVNWGLLPP